MYWTAAYPYHFFFVFDFALIFTGVRFNHNYEFNITATQNIHHNKQDDHNTSSPAVFLTLTTASQTGDIH